VTFLFDPALWARWLGIVVIDLTLAGDNALVIALAVRTLPRRQQLLGRLWGTAGAVALRIGFIAAVTGLLRVPLLHLLGGLLLVWIALKLVRQAAGDEAHIRQGGSLSQAVWIIIIADMAMSLDNVVAVAAAARGDLILAAFGISLSIPIVIWGSGLLARLMTRLSWIVWLGGGVLGYVAGEMALRDQLIQAWLGAHVAGGLARPLPIALGVVLVALGWWFDRSPGPTG
jgi:YjbE family integral membrane protein